MALVKVSTPTDDLCPFSSQFSLLLSLSFLLIGLVIDFVNSRHQFFNKISTESTSPKLVVSGQLLNVVVQ